MLRVELNSKHYLVRSLRYLNIDEWENIFPTEGNQTRLTRSGLASWDMFPHQGFGQNFMLNLKDDSGLFVDSTLETRWSDFISLPGLWIPETSWTVHTRASPYNTETDIVGGINFDDECWIFHGQTVSGVYKFYARYYNESTGDWDQVEEIATNAAATVCSPQSACVGGAYMYVLWTDSQLLQRYISRRSMAGAWTSATMTGAPTYGGVNRGLLLYIGNRLYWANWAGGTGIVTMYYSDDDGNNWTTGAATIVSKYLPTGLCAYAYSADDDTMVPYLVMAEGVYRYTIAGATPYKVLDLSLTADEWNGKGMANWEATGELFIPLGGYPLGQLVALSYKGGALVIRSAGLDIGPGLPTARQGRIVALLPAGYHLFAIVRNIANTQCSILILKYQWHHIYDSNTNASDDWPDSGTPRPEVLALSNVDGTQRLHLVFRSSTTGDAIHMNHPLERPINVSGFQYEPSGFLTKVTFGGDTIEDQKLFRRVWGVGESLSSDETITFAYGLDGAAPSTSLTALAASGTVAFGASSQGVSGRTIQIRKTLARAAGTNTNTPIVRGMALNYLTIPTSRVRAEMIIDIEETSKLVPDKGGGRGREGIITDLETARDSLTLVTFTGRVGTSATELVQKRVKVRKLGFDLAEIPDNMMRKDPERTGTATLLIEEL